jgi:hypothetical protein
LKKFFLGIFILFDLALIAGRAYVLYTHLLNGKSGIAGTAPMNVKSIPTASPAVVSSGTASVGTAVAPISAPSATQTRIFSYRNSHAKHVAIRADFTGWKAEPMQRDSAGVWTYRAMLSPGEYAYCFSVDEKPPLKDPANKRTKVIGRAVVSAIVVEASQSNPPK